MNFYTLFTRTENVHLLKDVGMIPEALAKEYPDIQSYLVTYKNGEYPYVGNEIKNTKMIFLEKKYGKYIDGIKFIRKNSNKIDCLNIYHLNLSSFLYCIAAKLYLKKNAKIYLKLDVNCDEIRKLRKKDIRSWIKRKTIKMADVVTGESSILVKQLQNEVDGKIQLLPNGYYDYNSHMADYKKKKNRIITVGRLGTVEKNTELLIDAFVKSSNKHDWELRLVGPYEEKIREQIKKVVSKNKGLEDRIVLTGEIIDKKKLAEEYEKAKVFVLPSKSESFGLVLIEALKAGDYIMTSSNVPAAYDIIYSKDAGKIVQENTVVEWADAIVEVTKKEYDWKKMCKDGFLIAEKKYKWEKIVSTIYRRIK